MKIIQPLFLLLVATAAFAQPVPAKRDTIFTRAKHYASTKYMDKAFLALDSAATLGFPKHKLLENDPLFAELRKDPRYKKLHERILDNAYPCRTLPEAKLFDFWLGDWDVYATANISIKTGFNRITRAARGCLILENWQANGAHEGMSINYFDPTDRKWKQKWVGSGQDIQEFYDGEYANNAMRFKFIGQNQDGSNFNGRLTFSNLAAGKVRQHSEMTNDDGKTWQTIYDFTYIRRVEGANP